VCHQPDPPCALPGLEGHDAQGLRQAWHHLKDRGACLVCGLGGGAMSDAQGRDCAKHGTISRTEVLIARVKYYMHEAATPHGRGRRCILIAEPVR